MRMKLLARALVPVLLAPLFTVLAAPSPAVAAARSVINPVPAYAQYIASDFNTSTNVWMDSSGYGRNTVAGDVNGTITKTTSTAGNGSQLTFPVIQGGTGDGLKFPVGILPATYTLFYLARFNGTTNRIFDGVDSNWLSGFYSAGVGNTFHGAWITPRGGSNDPITSSNWIYATDQQSLFRANGVQMSNGTSGTTSTARLSINYGAQSSERSQWQVAEVIVYDTALNASNILKVEGYLATKYGITNYTDASPVYSDFGQIGGNIVGDIVGGGWTTQLCPSGKVATGFSAVPSDGTGIYQVQLLCQSVSNRGVTSGAYSYTASGIGAATGTSNEQKCAANSALVGFDLYKGTSYGQAYNSINDAYFIGGATPKCAVLPTATSITSLNKVGGSTSAFSVNSYCASGAVVVGFTGRSGSLLNSLGVICGYVMGSSTFDVTGINQVGIGSTLTETSSVSARVPTVTTIWETSTTLNGTYVATANSTNSYSLSNADRLQYLRYKRTLSNYNENMIDSETVYVFDRLTATGGGDVSIPYGQLTTSAAFTGTAGSGGYSFALTSPPAGVSINASTGVITVANTTAQGSYAITVTVTDTLTITATKVFNLSVTTGVVIATLSLPGSATSTEYNRAVTVTASVTPAGKITFYENGRAILGCKNKTFSGSATCSWKPKQHGTIKLTARVTPTDTSNYSAATSTPLTIQVLKRTNLR